MPSMNQEVERDARCTQPLTERALEIMRLCAWQLFAPGITGRSCRVPGLGGGNQVTTHGGCVWIAKDRPRADTFPLGAHGPAHWRNDAE
jgi:hypothetical protein